MRRSVLLLFLVACAHQPAAHLFPPGAGECVDPAGCEAPTTEGRFELPDEEHAMPPAEAAKPDASCAGVGLAVSSLTVGNYATPDERAPAIAQGKARCENLKLDATARLCVVTSDDAASMAWCAPQMFELAPVAIVPPETCPDILHNAAATASANPNQLKALRESCKTDRWTETFGNCVRDSADAYSCIYVAPGPLQKKIAERIERAARP